MIDPYKVKKEECFELNGQGLTVAQIGRKIGVSDPTVRVWLRNAGIEPNVDPRFANRTKKMLEQKRKQSRFGGLR
jgi:uncharacterized protein YjcR